jgi:hypothetical protein
VSQGKIEDIFIRVFYPLFRKCGLAYKYMYDAICAIPARRRKAECGRIKRAMFASACVLKLSSQTGPIANDRRH